MDGILCIDKPEGFTSFDVVAKMRGVLSTRKIGHSGTLDPMATGVLPLFLGQATKAIDLLANHDKRYTATFRLGVTTDTQDRTGNLLETRPVCVGEAQLRKILPEFTGPLRQIPPMYSAVRVGGKRLYDLARSGQSVERPERDITIYRLDLMQADDDTHIYTVDVACSKGTYVRTLCHDIGQKLGCGAVLTDLRRTLSNGFSLSGCLTIDQARRLLEENALADHILPVDKALSHLQRLTLSDSDLKRFRNGMRVEPDPPLSGDAGPVALYNREGRFLAVADIRDRALKSRKWFYHPDMP